MVHTQGSLVNYYGFLFPFWWFTLPFDHQRGLTTHRWCTPQRMMALQPIVRFLFMATHVARFLFCV